MSITLFELCGKDRNKKFSPHCWKSHLALSYKGLEFNSQSIQFTEIKEKIAVNDYSLVPVLRDGEATITDSWNIAEYLDEQYPENSLFVDDAGKALSQSINHWCDTVLSKYVRPLIIMNIYNLIGEKDRAYFRSSREAKLGMTLEDCSAKASGALQGFRQELESIREVLAMQEFIGGESPTYADICLMGSFLWVGCVSDIQLIEEDDIVYPWYQRMLELNPDAKAAVNV